MARKNEKYTVKKFNKISIGLASPESILGTSKGEVLKPETINYRTHKLKETVFSVSVFLVL